MSENEKAVLTREEFVEHFSTIEWGPSHVTRILAHDAALREEVERLTQERDEAQSVAAGAILDAGASKSANYVFRQLAWACAKGRNGPLPPDIEWIRPQHREVGDMVISVLKQFQDRVATLESALRDAPQAREREQRLAPPATPAPAERCACVCHRDPNEHFKDRWRQIERIAAAALARAQEPPKAGKQ